MMLRKLTSMHLATCIFVGMNIGVTSHARTVPASATIHASRQECYLYWQRSIRALAIADKAQSMASASFSRGEMSHAHAAIHKGEVFSRKAYVTVRHNIPLGWSEVSQGLQYAALHFSDAFYEHEKYAETHQAMYRSRAEQYYQRAEEDMSGTTALAREKYVAMGGRAASLDDVSSIADHG